MKGSPNKKASPDVGVGHGRGGARAGAWRGHMTDEGRRAGVPEPGDRSTQPFSDP